MLRTTTHWSAILRSAPSIAWALAVCLGWTATAIGQDESSQTTWTNAKGNSLKAEFVRVSGDSVILKVQGNGREVSVPLVSLSFDSHLQAIKLANPEAFSKPLVKAPSGSGAMARSSSPAMLDVSEVLRSPIPDNPSIEQLLSTIETELNENNNPMVLWHALTPSMQADVESVIIKAADVGGPFITQFQTLIGHLSTIVQSKKQFVLSHPFVASQPQLVSQLNDAWPAISSAVVALDTPSLWDKSNFTPGNVAPWLAKVFRSLEPLEEHAGNFPTSGATPGWFGDLKNIKTVKLNILSQSADSAEVELLGDGGQGVLKLSLKKVDGRWLPSEMLDQWDRAIEEINRKLSSVKPGDLATTNFLFGSIVGTLAQLAQADSQEAFDKTAVGLLPGQPLGDGTSRPGADQPGNIFGN